MSPRAPSGPARLLERAGHLALWVGLYFAGAYATGAVLLGRELSPLALGATFAAGVGLYLLDRVKIRDEWLDPADLRAQPGRHGFLRGGRARVRALAWALLGAGTLAVASIHPINLLLPPVGIGGVVIYGSVRGRRVRPKDVLVLKNALPGAAISGLAIVFAWQSPGHAGPPPLAPASAVLLALFLVVTADAMLCDIDDASVDRQFGTQTLATRFGKRTTWGAAVSMHAGACSLIVGLGHAPGLLRVAAAWAAADLTLTGALWVWDPPSLRDLVDARLPLVALIAWSFA